MGYSVGQVAKYADVTVRTLHHYDEIGLLSPSGRSSAGYRRYDDSDLERLQSLLFYRELGFPLEEIAAILGDPDADATAHLRRQRELLLSRIGRLQDMVAAVEFAMEARQVGITLTPEERFEVFGNHDPAEHEVEAERRWGGTDAFRESARRTRSYTKEDWLVIKGQAASINQRLALAMTSGIPADDPQATDLAEEHRQHITRWYYDCTYEIHRGLAEMYVADPRFTATIDADGEGLAVYVRAAILANADRAEG
ncbi:HTH-type transcriptional activator TipA [Longispora fulva]|uniref:DNA-binding transcriptional MerR regulator n=1 Tax=Longispora fulva TaxID=619741 RepID=A0A8J7GFG6_9ACTN|nr:MerR family transcriptional regulator [Longispora fulva]MBG6139713.1 DNA-binding transcriptional MerR regulator [Longispora fulva]GIG57903.1 HTH-type transcriptional activator TipA [Longispora fulva]